MTQMCMHAGDSRPVTSIMTKVARSKGARVAASLDTGTVLRDLLQTVAPETPDSTGTGHSVPARRRCP